MAVHAISSCRVIVSAILRKLAFFFLRKLYMLFRGVWWHLNGTSALISAAQHNLDRCAQVCKVLTWMHIDLGEPVGEENFLLAHEGFVNPTYVLQHDHISLFFLDLPRQMAVFGVGRRGQLLWHSDLHPFFTLSMFKHSTHLVLMPLTAFFQLAKTLPDPRGRLVVLGNTMRCGSSLLVQVFEHTDCAVAYNEPPALKEVSTAYEKQGACADVQRLTKAVVKFYCKPLEVLPNPAVYLFKPHGAASLCLAPIKDAYPQSSLLFLHRDVIKVAESIFRMSFAQPILRAAFILSRLDGRLLQALYRLAGFPSEGANVSFRDNLSYSVFLAVSSARVYTSLREKGADIRGVWYEDLLAAPEHATAAIFHVCGLPVSLVAPALRAFKQDSQRASAFSRKALSRAPVLQYTEADKVRASNVMQEMGHGGLSLPWKLPGTLVIQGPHCETVRM